jgi:hypothetical protein
MVRSGLFNKIKLFVDKGKKLPKSLPENWQQDYPLFNFEITMSGKYKLNNKTGYVINGSISEEYQLECLKRFNKANIAEGGKAVKRVAMVLCVNADEHEFYKFTNGWIPNQDTHNREINTSTACLIEYKDETNTGWLKWSSNNTINGSLNEVDILLYLLSNSTRFQCRLCARDARNKYVATLQKIK